MQQYISAIVGVVVVTFLAILMGAAQRGKPTTDRSTGFLVFRHHILLRLFSLVAAFGIPLVLTALVIANPPENQSDTIAILGIYAMFGVLSAPLLWESMRFALVVSPEGLDCHSPWRGQQFIRWEEVEQVSYSSLLGWFVIRADGGRKFRVSAMIPGLNAFLEACEQRVSPAQLSRAKAGYTLLGRPFREEKK
ncbi:hypothetical protein [Tuwongella immobilis]|uniref:: bPH_6 n=1 Tax=Tuwongella immobilis TaxID=692036 RepID=A0A6C2YHD6_9BACT|nr:hypothetical protein [Tuwongella immobilis]VIP00661.1 : bPH_6 [Tuwongella immobilis]VTR96740.1 : bPH_6 [Tuwongella immobilis]